MIDTSTLAILAFDLGNHCGFADSNANAGSWAIWSGEGPRPAARLDCFRELLRAKIRDVQPDLIVHEAITAGGGFKTNYRANQSLVELLTCLKIEAEAAGVSMRGFHLSSLKAFAAHGRASKREMIEAYKRHHGVDFGSDHDACDAAWLIKYAQRPDLWPVKKPRKTKAKGKPKGPQGVLFR